MRKTFLYTLHFDPRRYNALKAALADSTGESVRDKLMQAFDSLYKEYVSAEARELIDTEIEQEELQLQAAQEAQRTFAVCHIRENGEDQFFRSDAFRNTMYIAERYRQYEQGILSGAPSAFADAFIDTEPISPQEYARACENINYDERITAIWEFNLDDGTIGICDSSDNAWNTYRLQDFAQAASNVFQKNRQANDHAKEKIFNRSLAGKEVVFEDDEAAVQTEDDGEDESPVMQM